MTSLTTWLRRILRSPAADDDAAEREEYALPDPGEAELRAGAPGVFEDSARAVADELDGEFKAPRDPNP